MKRSRMITAGVRFYNEEDVGVASLALTDRCNVERDGRYKCSLPQRKMRFIENGSQIVVELDNRREEPVVRFKHYRHGKLVNKKKSHFSLEGLVQNEKCYAKMYIEQYYGRGNYSIRETRKSRRDLRTRRRSSKKLRAIESKRKLELQYSPRTADNVINVADAASPSTASSRRRAIGGRKGYRRSI